MLCDASGKADSSPSRSIALPSPHPWLTYNNAYADHSRMGSGIALAFRAEPKYEDVRMRGYTAGSVISLRFMVWLLLLVLQTTMAGVTVTTQLSLHVVVAIVLVPLQQQQLKVQRAYWRWVGPCVLPSPCGWNFYSAAPFASVR